MARRRMIDPNIWSSEDMSKLTIRQRLLVIGLFSNADDEGKGKAKPAYIRSTVFPYDDLHIHEIIDDLETIRAVITVEFYEVEGNSYYKFLNWSKWQRVDKPQPSIIPEPIENHSGIIPEQFLPKGKEEKRKEEKAGVPTFDNPHNSKIEEWLKTYNVRCRGVSDLEDVFSYVGAMEIEVIEYCVKKAEGQHVPYLKSILDRHLREGKTTKESIQTLQIVGGTKETKRDPELEARRREVELNRWIAEGKDPREFVYQPA